MPDNAASRMIRGVALKEMKKLDLALKDFDAAVKLSPKSTRALDARANLLHFMKQYEGAIADYDAMIKIDPEDAMAYAHRGFSRFGKMDLAKALEDYDEALRLSPKQSWAGLNRPVILLLLRKRGVVDACQDFLEVHGFKDRLSPYVGIIGYLGARQEKAEFSAKQFLDDSKKFGSAWPAPIFKLLQGDIDADALLAQAKENGEQTEARCYIGCNYLLKNQKKEAASHFRWVVENGDPGYVEYLIARLELDRLKTPGDPKR